MTTETVTLRQRDGTAGAAQAEITRYDDARRMMRAAPFAVGGVVIGAASIVVPGVHFVSTWLLPLLGITVAVFVYRTTTRVGTVTGACPSCDEQMTLTEGGTLDGEPLWLRCNHCATPLELRLGAPDEHP